MFPIELQVNARHFYNLREAAGSFLQSLLNPDRIAIRDENHSSSTCRAGKTSLHLHHVHFLLKTS